MTTTHLSYIDYPANLPCIDRDSFSYAVDLGLVRAGHDSVLPTQRRAYDNMPIVITAGFTMNIADLFDWGIWINRYIGYWVNFRLAHPFMTGGILVEKVPARILNGTIAKSYRMFNTITASLELQLSPSVFAESPTRDYANKTA